MAMMIGSAVVKMPTISPTMLMKKKKRSSLSALPVSFHSFTDVKNEKPFLPYSLLNNTKYFQCFRRRFPPGATTFSSVSSIDGDDDHNDIVASFQLPGDLCPELMPKHVALIMDGHGRWADDRGLPTEQGHIAGLANLRRIVLKACCTYQIKVLTAYAFSTQNWTRSETEIDLLMTSFEDLIRSDVMDFILRGRLDITEASKKIAIEVKDGTLQANGINEDVLEQHLMTRVMEFPNPDLLIRTSGELRVSNFLLWQLAYTELYFVDKMFPDFNDADFMDALTSFQCRNRRYGRRKK